jgi:hypothetical protein
MIARIATAAVALGLAAVPAAAQAPTDTGAQQRPGGTEISPPKKKKSSPRGRALGYYCRGQSKKKVEGQKRSPFSQCVRALARVKRGKASPKVACRSLARKRLEGQKAKGTPYSLCVRGATRLRRAERRRD